MDEERKVGGEKERRLFKILLNIYNKENMTYKSKVHIYKLFS